MTPKTIKELKELINDLPDEMKINYKIKKYSENGTVYCNSSPTTFLLGYYDVEIQKNNEKLNIIFEL